MEEEGENIQESLLFLAVLSQSWFFYLPLDVHGVKAVPALKLRAAAHLQGRRFHIQPLLSQMPLETPCGEGLNLTSSVGVADEGSGSVSGNAARFHRSSRLLFLVV